MTDVDQRPSAVVPLHDHRGRFAPNNPGRVPGSRNKVSQVALAEVRNMRDDALTILRQKLAAGDWEAVVFVLERVLPKGRPVEMEDTSAATVTDMLSRGELTIPEAKDLATAIEKLRSVESLDVLNARIDALEKAMAGNGPQR